MIWRFFMQKSIAFAFCILLADCAGRNNSKRSGRRPKHTTVASKKAEPAAETSTSTTSAPAPQTITPKKTLVNGGSTRRKSTRSSSSAGKGASKAEVKVSNGQTAAGSSELTDQQKKIIDDFLLLGDFSANETSKVIREMQRKRAGTATARQIIDYVNRKMQSNTKTSEIVDKRLESLISWNNYTDVLVSLSNGERTDAKLAIGARVIKAKFGIDISPAMLRRHIDEHYMNYKMRRRMRTSEDELVDDVFIAVVERMSKGNNPHLLIPSNMFLDEEIVSTPKKKQVFFKKHEAKDKIVTNVCQFMKLFRVNLRTDVPTVDGQAADKTFNYMKPNKKIAENVSALQLWRNMETMINTQAWALEIIRQTIKRNEYNINFKASYYENLAYNISVSLYVPPVYLGLYLQVIRDSYMRMLRSGAATEEAKFFDRMATAVEKRSLSNDPMLQETFLYAARHCSNCTGSVFAHFFVFMSSAGRAVTRACPDEEFICASLTAANSLDRLADTLIMFYGEDLPLATFIRSVADNFTSNQLNVNHEKLRKNYSSKFSNVRPSYASDEVKRVSEQANTTYDQAVTIANEALQAMECLSNKCEDHKSDVSAADLQKALDEISQDAPHYANALNKA